ncbi:SDR family NAD(P)-dependent oxidoreductase [Mycolicibacterium goodii]|uniref:SDR family NAD(P)-dependent oxidoreductase n=1 Tax=Mycolicibacterium goodii TaxID=134601 RepID=UPI00257F120E|nr:SDR family NAD(P)-dependent oxidoreductase [Mycolicibacterium goodii]
MSRIWFVTGCSRGLGREFAEVALRRGDRVAATARNIESLDQLTRDHGDAVLTLPLDVTDSTAVVESVDRAHHHFGALDVIVNSAGFIVHGAVEEVTEQALRDQLETNFFFGPWRVIRAALPHLRAQGYGHIVQISSMAGVVAYPTLGAYHASKWALEGLSEALAGQVAKFGVKVTIIEPGRYAITLLAGSVQSERRAEMRRLALRTQRSTSGRHLGRPNGCRHDLVERGRRRKPAAPRHLRVGFLKVAQQTYADRLDVWSRWSGLSEEAQGHRVPLGEHR